MQHRYWVELQTIKAHAYYLELYQLRSENIERGISIGLAIASSSSIAGWVIWEKYAFIWACLIMASQVTSAVYRYLPFKARIKPLSAAGVEISILANTAEKAWYDISRGELTEGDINQKLFSLREKSSAILKSAFGGMVIPENEKLLRKAEQQMFKHFKSHYPELQNE
ncbi:hypothetical protein [Pseudomonas syringae]|uniref:hypothetical protein n=1 Tax=Pseudomonas syringae TaxID=317 RepID=UPI0011D0444B|nr:hypothetical protein [Pseudomonas syringae]